MVETTKGLTPLTRMWLSAQHRELLMVDVCQLSPGLSLPSPPERGHHVLPARRCTCHFLPASAWGWKSLQTGKGQGPLRKWPSCFRAASKKCQRLSLLPECNVFCQSALRPRDRPARPIDGDPRRFILSHLIALLLCKHKGCRLRSDS